MYPGWHDKMTHIAEFILTEIYSIFIIRMDEEEGFREFLQQEHALHFLLGNNQANRARLRRLLRAHNLLFRVEESAEIRWFYIFMVKIIQPNKNHLMELVRDFPGNVNRGINRANQMIQNARDIIRSVLNSLVSVSFSHYIILFLKPSRNEQGIQLDIIFGAQAEADNIDEALGDELEDHEIEEEESEEEEDDQPMD